LEAYTGFKNKETLQFPELFGDGKAAEFICQQMIENF